MWQLKKKAYVKNEHELRIEKKYCSQQTKTNSISYIFFQSSTLGQIDDEISRLIRT